MTPVTIDYSAVVELDRAIELTEDVLYLRSRFDVKDYSVPLIPRDDLVRILEVVGDLQTWRRRWLGQ